MLNNHYFFNLITVGLLLIGAAPTIAQPNTNSPARTESALATVSFKPPPDREEGIKHHSQTFLSITGTSGIISLKPSDNSPP